MAVAAKRRAGTQNSKAYASRDELPGALETADDCARWLRWITIQTVTGELDPVAAREATKPVIALQRMIQQREGLDRRLKEMERRLRDKGARGA